MKKIGLLFATIIMAMLFVVSASAATEGYYTYKVENGEATITDVDTSISGDVVIPDTLGGYPVTVIGDRAFSWCRNLASVTIPGGVTSIGDKAFYCCDKFTSFVVNESNNNYSNDGNGVLFNKEKTEIIQYPCKNKSTTYVIPDSVTTIGDEAFDDCKDLTSITIPDSVTSIGEDAFSRCSSLRNVYITDVAAWCAIDFKTDASNPFLGRSGDYFGEGNLYLNNELVEDLIIPDGVTTIKQYAFARCGFKSITIPDSVTTIGDFAFGFCGLTSITIPESVTTIGNLAFACCIYLTEITVDENNQYFSNDEFGVLFNKDKTELIQFPSKFPTVDLHNISTKEYFDILANNAIEYTIPDTVKVIGDGAFLYCFFLKHLNIPEGVTTIGEMAFNGGMMFYMYIPGSITQIGSGTSMDLFNVELGEGTTSINYGNMKLMRGAHNIMIPETVTEIEDNIFSNYMRDELVDIFYAGTQEQWNNIELTESDKAYLKNVNIHFNYHCDSHEYTSEFLVYPPCYDIGVKKYTCENCGWYYYEVCFDVDNHTMSEWTVVSPATCTTEGVERRSCENAEYCGYSETRKIPSKTHTMSDWIVEIEPTCTTDGKKYRQCTVCYGAYESEKMSATYHKDSNKDGICDNCKESIDSSSCSCNCHKKGFMGFIWKIVLFFNKLFKTNRGCACGIAHY